MAKAVRYYGEFVSVGNVLWRVEILQEGYAGTQPTQLTLPYDTPLSLEWNEVNKIDTVQSCTATLTLVSDSDRQFVDLYTVEACSTRLDVYRNGDLYWSGTLDPELYEEPFAYKDGYEVILTFSDLANLDRFDWDGEGLMSIQAMVEKCLEKSAINYGQIIKHISTSVYASAYSATDPITLGEVNVLQENFYDEDGEAKTYREVLEAVLLPFALRIVQKGGNIYIYDLNAIHAMTTETVEWASDDSNLSTDVVYNNVKVTFSPYADTKMIEGKVTEDKALTADSGGRLFKMTYERQQNGTLATMDGFRLHHNATLESDMEIMNGAEFFQISSVYSGSDETGVAYAVRAGDYGMSVAPASSFSLIIGTGANKNGFKRVFRADNGVCITQPIIKCKTAYLGHASINRSNYRIRVSLSLLFDTRYNPFEDAGGDNEEGNYQKLKDWCNLGYVPFMLTLRGNDGTALFHYENHQVMESDGYTRNGNNCKWVAGEGEWGCAFLCYYDIENRRSETGFGGWKTNKPIIGYYQGGLPANWKNIEDGEYIDLPTCGGFLELQIGSGVHQFDWKRETKDIYSIARWLMYKEPTVSLCKRSYKDVEIEDIEDSAWISRSAKEKLELETILGTMPQNHGVPNAKGQLYNNAYSVYSTFGRAGVNDRLERLLIGTVYSQYAGRKNNLSGTVALLPEFGIFTDVSEPGEYLLLSEVQDCMQDTSEILMSQFSEDNYEGVEYE